VPDLRDTSADVSGFYAVNDDALTVPAATQGIHRARLGDYLVSQIVGTCVATGGVMAARRFAPKHMQQLSQAIERFCDKSLHQESAQYAVKQSRRTADYIVMFGSGLASTAGTQIALARQRRNRQDGDNDVELGQDFKRVMTGWGVGCFGAAGSIALADRYLRKGSRHSISNFLNDSEAFLDRHLLGGFEFVPERKLSEALVANVAMIPGGGPMSVVGQRLYDAVAVAPDNAREVV
jgi:hypothetical protein